MVLAHMDDALDDDDDYSHFLKSLSYRSTLVVKVNELESGYSRDVDGEISILGAAQAWHAAGATENQNFHFKLTETSVKLRAKGLSAGFV